jgi:hypothetical protein
MSKVFVVSTMILPLHRSPGKADSAIAARDDGYLTFKYTHNYRLL